MTSSSDVQSGERISLAPVGVLVYLVGAGLTVWSLFGLVWFQWDSQETFDDLAHWIPDPTAKNAALFDAYFGWLAWTVTAVIGALCLISCVLGRRRWIGIAGLCVGVAGAVVAVAALLAEGGLLDDSLLGLLRSSRIGLWLVLWGYLMAGAGVLLTTFDMQEAVPPEAEHGHQDVGSEA